MIIFIYILKKLKLLGQYLAQEYLMTNWWSQDLSTGLLDLLSSHPQPLFQDGHSSLKFSKCLIDFRPSLSCFGLLYLGALAADVLLDIFFFTMGSLLEKCPLPCFWIHYFSFFHSLGQTVLFCFGNAYTKCFILLLKFTVDHVAWDSHFYLLLMK